jgi:hypothetical protein
MGTAPAWSLDLSGGNAFQSPTRFSVSLEAAGDDDGASRRELSGTLSLQASPRISLQISPTYSESTTARQYVDTLAGGRAATFGQRYIFAAVDQRTFLMQFRASLILKPDLTLDIYAEPFAASGRYRDHGELLAPRSRQLRAYGQEGTQVTAAPEGSLLVRDGSDTFVVANNDFRELSFRSNVVLRWEYRPGSTFYAVWQQDRSNSARYARAGVSDLFDSLSAPGDNIFALKASFFWGGR